MAINDRYLLTDFQNHHGSRVINTWRWRQVSGSSSPTPIQVISAFTSTLLPLIRACQSNELLHEQINCQRYYPLPGDVPVISDIADVAGTVAESSLPTSVAVVVTRRGTLATRHNYGRVYLGGVPVSFELNSMVSAAGLTAYGQLTQQIPVGLTIGDAGLAPILDRAAPDVNSFVTVTASNTNKALRNQRRRQIGVGV